MNPLLLLKAMSGMLGLHSVPQVLVSEKGTTKKVQFKFPRSKSKRIRNKFKKNPNNFKIKYISIKMNNPITGGEILIVHPSVHQKMIAESLIGEI